MREILFRGQREDTGEWVYGDLTHLAYGIITIQYNITVIPKTVGECTGLKDSTGVRIFEGDIVNFEGKNYIIEYIKVLCAFEMKSINRDLHLRPYNLNNSLIIGNIYDNPELLKPGIRRRRR